MVTMLPQSETSNKTIKLGDDGELQTEKFCSNCGSRNTLKANYCLNCGVSFTDPSAALVPVPNRAESLDESQTVRKNSDQPNNSLYPEWYPWMMPGGMIFILILGSIFKAIVLGFWKIFK